MNLGEASPQKPKRKILWAIIKIDEEKMQNVKMVFFGLSNSDTLILREEA